MRVLFIDEDETSVADGMERLKESGHDCQRIDFDKLDERLSTYQPDIIVLDMMNGDAPNDPKGEGGKTSFDKIWNTRFCPIVVYSANPDLIDDIESGNADHPLVKKVKKGRDSDEKLKQMINEFKPCIDGINGITEDVSNALQVTLKKIAPRIVSQGEIVEIAAAIQHMGRRRLAAQMDDSSMWRSKLAPWEQYIWPPLESYPKMGDIIRDTKADPNAPESYRIVLTPSCDLVNKDGQKQKVTNVLCASCENSDLLQSKVSGSKVKDIKNNLPGLLTKGYIDECLPIPGFQGVIPPMVANLKKLELIPYESIKNEDDGINFVRVASVDSPFREQIAWAYMQTGSRPGVPDRDCERWAKQYLDDGTNKGEKKS
jgi:CTP synthase